MGGAFAEPTDIAEHEVARSEGFLMAQFVVPDTRRRIDRVLDGHECARCGSHVREEPGMRGVYYCSGPRRCGRFNLADLEPRLPPSV